MQIRQFMLFHNRYDNFLVAPVSLTWVLNIWLLSEVVEEGGWGRRRDLVQVGMFLIWTESFLGEMGRGGRQTCVLLYCFSPH